MGGGGGGCGDERTGMSRLSALTADVTAALSAMIDVMRCFNELVL